ncbi:MAG TPA: hypothetical protein VK489_04955 [Ferruginibacter sp.]|nr:hypothetical protein [Ferruginibacter sp.]
MKKVILFALLFLAAAIVSEAQPRIPLKKVSELQMRAKIDDEEKMAGTRGASIIWHPVQKKYYASFAGNTGYPMGVFDDKGNRLSSDDQTTMIDTRGLWYNPAAKSVSGNGFSETGWFTYTLDNSGMPTDLNVLIEGMNQPDAQSVGTYNTANKRVLFLKGGRIFMYDNDGIAQDSSTAIHWGRRKIDGASEDEDLSYAPEDYNYTTVVYTGAKGQELGVLNITNKQVELYDISTGFLTKILTLPETAKTEAAFNFGYANGIYWLFNIELRKWIGYK